MGNRQSNLNQQNDSNNKPIQKKTNVKKPHKSSTVQTMSNLDSHDINPEVQNSILSQRDQNEYNQDDEFFEDLGFYSGGDQAAPTQNDIRVPHYDTSSTYPFNSIVRIISVFKEIPTSNPRDFQFGSGVALNPRVCISVAHNVWEKNIKKMPDYIFVEPETEHEEKKLIRVEKFGIHKIYLDQSNNFREEYDLCILILEQNEFITPNMTMRMKQNYNFNLQRDAEIIVAGFPKDRNEQNPGRYIQYHCTKKIESKSKNFMNYSHFTSAGQSGAPLILRFINAQGNADYVIIGLHKGNKGKSYGILTTTENRNEILQIARSQTISDPNNPAEVQSKKNATQSLIKSIDMLFKQRNSVSIESQNIVWKKLTLKAKSLNELVRFNDPNSFQSSIGTIEKTLKVSVNVSHSSRSQSLLSDFVVNAFFDKLKKASFNIEQQEEYFRNVENYVDASFGHTKIADEFQFCGNVGEKLYILHNKLFNKPEQVKLNDQTLTLKAMDQKLITKRENIIKKIQSGYLPAVSQKQRQRGRVERQLNFLLKLNDFPKAQEYIDSKSEQNQKILALKGYIMKMHGNLKRAKIFYERCKNKMQTQQQRQSREYLDSLTGLGQVYRMRNQFTQALQCFNQNLSIRKRINGEKSIEYAQAMNFISTFYIEMGNYNKAIEELVKVLEIAESHHGENSPELIKYLSNIAVVYYYKSEFTKSISYSERTLSIIQATKGKDSLDMIEIISNMGAALRASKRPREALDWYKRSLKIEEFHRGEDNFFCAPILNNIGNLYLNLGDVKESQNHIRRSLSIYEKHSQQNDVQNNIGHGLALYNMACVYEAQNRYKEATQEARKSHQKLKLAAGIDHIWVKNSFELWNKCKKQAK